MTSTPTRPVDLSSGEKAVPTPPPPPPTLPKTEAPLPRPEPPSVPSDGPQGAFLIELLLFNGHPFNDHWSYWVRSHSDSNVGVVLHATGDVRNGFRLEIKRNYDFYNQEHDIPTKRIPLQWVDGQHFDEAAMLNYGVIKFDDKPVCGFEHAVFKVEAPEKTLNDESTSGKKITQRDCQTWIVESADQLVRDGIFGENVAKYLHAIKQ